MNKTLQDAAFYVDGPGATVVWSKPDNDLYVVSCGEMRIHLGDDVIRNTDQLEKAGITTDKQLMAIDVDDWVNNPWFELWSQSDTRYGGEPYFDLDDAIHAALQNEREN